MGCREGYGGPFKGAQSNNSSANALRHSLKFLFI
jgi:hypothetical protein